MKFIVYLLGFLWVAAGALMILYTDDCKAYFNALMDKLDRMYLAIIPSGFGLLLVFAGSTTTHAGIIIFIGVLGIAKGVLIYFNPGGLFEITRTWLDSLSEQGFRLMGILSLVLGTVVISWIQ